MQACDGNLAIDPLPDGNGDVLGGRKRGLELGYLEVEMAMIVDANHFALQDVLDLFEIDDEAADRINLARNRHLQGVVVAMTVAVGAFAEGALVLLLRPGVDPVEVRGGEIDFAGKKDDRVWFNNGHLEFRLDRRCSDGD